MICWCTDLTLNQKVEIVQLVQKKNLSQIKIAKRSNVLSQPSPKLIRTKTPFWGKWTLTNPILESESDPARPSMLKELYKWFVDARMRDAPVKSAVKEDKDNHLA